MDRRHGQKPDALWPKGAAGATRVGFDIDLIAGHGPERHMARGWGWPA